MHLCIYASIEEVENGNNLIIHNADFTDEAKFSCCISDHSKTELNHNVRVIANDQHARGREEKHPEISGMRDTKNFKLIGK